jgi:hypothetical protein
MHTAKPCGNIGVAVPCLARPSPPGIFILDDGVGLVAKRIEIIPSTTPQMLCISSENSACSSYLRRIDEVHIIGRVVWFARRL